MTGLTIRSLAEQGLSQAYTGTSDLRRELMATLRDLREGKVGSSQANAAARIGEVVVTSLHVELQAVKELGTLHGGLPNLPLYVDEDEGIEDAEVVEGGKP